MTASFAGHTAITQILPNKTANCFDNFISRTVCNFLHCKKRCFEMKVNTTLYDFMTLKTPRKAYAAIYRLSHRRARINQTILDETTLYNL